MEPEKTLSLTAFAFVLLFCNENNSLIVKPKDAASPLLEPAKKESLNDPKPLKRKRKRTTAIV